MHPNALISDSSRPSPILIILIIQPNPRIHLINAAPHSSSKLNIQIAKPPTKSAAAIARARIENGIQPAGAIILEPDVSQVTTPNMQRTCGNKQTNSQTMQPISIHGGRRPAAAAAAAHHGENHCPLSGCARVARACIIVRRKPNYLRARAKGAQAHTRVAAKCNHHLSMAGWLACPTESGACNRTQHVRILSIIS